MLAKLGRPLRRAFKQKLLELFPSWRELRGPAISGLAFFGEPVDGRLTIFVVLHIAGNREEFTVSIGWCHGDSLPDTENCVEHIEKLDHSKEVFFRLANCWGESDYWWCLAERPTTNDIDSFFRDVSIPDALQKMEPAVDDAINRIQEFAIPYWNRVLKYHGIERTLCSARQIEPDQA